MASFPPSSWLHDQAKKEGERGEKKGKKEEGLLFCCFAVVGRTTWYKNYRRLFLDCWLGSMSLCEVLLIIREKFRHAWIVCYVIVRRRIRHI